MLYQLDNVTKDIPSVCVDLQGMYLRGLNKYTHC